MEVIEPFVQYGLLGVVLAWFMNRNEKLLQRMTKSLNLHSRILLMLVERTGSTDLKNDELQAMKRDLEEKDDLI